MRLNEFIDNDVPEVGDILEVEIGDELVETVIVEIVDGTYIVETDSGSGMTLLESVAEDQVPSEVTHRGDIDRTADIEVLGVDHNAGTFNITYNKKPYTVKTSLLSQEDFDHWQIADYEVEIINSNGKNLLDMIDWNNEGDAKTDRQIRMIDTIIAYLDTQRTSDIQYMAWKHTDADSAEELYNNITNFYKEDKQKIKQAALWLSKNIQDADARQAFAAFVQNIEATQNTSKPQKVSEYTMYVAFSYSREGNTEMTPGMKLPGIQLTDPDDEDELAQKLDALFKKVEFKFDAFEKKIIELGETFGFGTPDVESGLGARSMYWDQTILTSEQTASITAKTILKFEDAINKYVQSFSSSLTKIGLPGITEYSTWEGVLSDKLTKQQEDYFTTPEGFANIAKGKINVAKMINDNIQRQGVAEGSDQGEYSRVLTALRLYHPRFEMEELNTPEWYRVIANKANVTPEYAGQVINDFVKASQPDEEENLDWMDDTDHVKEAEYQGRTVKLGKPQQGDVKKFKVYVKNPKTGKTIKVNFGDPNMRIKKSNPKRRKSFRARHNCANPGPRTKARYWSCRKW